MDEISLRSTPPINGTICPKGAKEVKVLLGEQYKACNTAAITT
jgi:hypothetical protein